MGGFGDWGAWERFAFGKDTTAPSVEAPAFPNMARATGMMNRAEQVAKDPASSQQFKTFRKQSTDSAAQASRSILEQIDKSFQGDLGSGAAIKTKVGAMQDVNVKRVSSERDFMQYLTSQSDKTMLDILRMMSQYRADTFRSEVASIRTEHEAGLFDWLTDYGTAKQEQGAGTSAVFEAIGDGVSLFGGMGMGA